MPHVASVVALGLTPLAHRCGASTQQTVPGTGEPLADIWEVNHFIAKRQARHFDRMFGSDALEPEMRGWVADAE